MGLRLFKKVKIAKGVSVNISKSGASLSVGPKGAKVTINNKGGVTASTSIPGTGISYREKMNPKSKRSKSVLGSGGGYASVDVQEVQGASGQDDSQNETAFYRDMESPAHRVLVATLKVLGGFWSFCWLVAVIMASVDASNGGSALILPTILTYAVVAGFICIGLMPIIRYRKRACHNCGAIDHAKRVKGDGLHCKHCDNKIIKPKTNQ
jgi:hypothetical protein